MKRTPLKRKAALKAYRPLKARKPLRARQPLRTRKPLKARQRTARKLGGPYSSIFTDDMAICHITGDCRDVEPHHIFQGAYKALSEKYGFMVPLRSDWHRTAPYAIHADHSLSTAYKMRCQEYYISVLGKSREDWLGEFGRWWTGTDMEG